jgi:5-oxoprolinase (ATP-hydrolysing) subunit A
VTERWIDLNADVGEVPAALADGTEAALLAEVTSVNVACGGHAGDAGSMAAVAALAVPRGIAIGAHPSYPDREGFGRREMALPHALLADAVQAQTQALDAIARAHGTSLRHVKPHGALYNAAARDGEVAAAIAAALRPWRGRVWLVGLAGSVALEVWRNAGFDVAPEAFADRRYEADGSLRSRAQADALLVDPASAAAQAVDIVAGRGALSASGLRLPIVARTLCIHGDTPGAAGIARAVRSALAAAGIRLQALPAR